MVFPRMKQLEIFFAINLIWKVKTNNIKNNIKRKKFHNARCWYFDLDFEKFEFVLEATNPPAVIRTRPIEVFRSQLKRRVHSAIGKYRVCYNCWTLLDTALKVSASVLGQKRPPRQPKLFVMFKRYKIGAYSSLLIEPGTVKLSLVQIVGEFVALAIVSICF